jgi:hypothetical protein
MKKLTFNRRKRRKRILDKVLRLIENKHFNLSNVTAWQTIVAARSTQILNATNAERFEKGIQSLLSQLGSSHTGFFHKSGRMSRLGMRSMPPLGLAPFEMASWTSLQNTAKKFHPIIGEHSF